MPRSSRPAPTSRSPGSDASQPATTGPKSSGGSASCTPCSPMTGPEPPGRWAQLAVLSTILLLGLVPWFSAASVAPLIAAEWQIDAVETSLLTVAVQVGFAVGALFIALTGAADVVPAGRLMGGGGVRWGRGGWRLSR